MSEPTPEATAAGPELVDRLRANRQEILATATQWEKTAYQLAALRNDRRLPKIVDELGEPQPMRFPFKLGDYHNELEALSGLITKAFTIAALYHDHVEWLDDAISELTRSSGQ